MFVEAEKGLVVSHIRGKFQSGFWSVVEKQATRSCGERARDVSFYVLYIAQQESVVSVSAAGKGWDILATTYLARQQ